MSNTTNSISSMNVTSSSSKRLSGLVSGLDTDNLVKQLTIGTQKKIDKQIQNKQIASWKQTAYREVIQALSEFKDKYLSSSSNSNSILSPSFFTSVGIKNTSPFLNVSGNADVARKMVVTKISQLAKQASFSSSHEVSNGEIKTGKISENFTKCNVLANSLTINYGGNDYTIKMSSDIDINDSTPVQSIIDDLNNQISENEDLKGKVSFTLGSDADGKKIITLSTDSDITIKDGSDKLLDGLGLTKNSTYADKSTSSISKDSLYSTANLSDTLSGSTLTFSLNGLKKNITFDKTEESKFSSVDSLQSHLQTELDKSYGTGKITVTKNTDDTLSFKTTDSTSIVSIESCDNFGILGKNGALHTYAGETNRINLHKTLDDVNENFSSELTAGSDGKYSININDKVFTFEGTDTIEDIISEINSDDKANVMVTYSSVTDSFSVTAKNGGSGSRVDIKDVSGNLADVLFGTDRTPQILGQDAKINISFDGNKDNTVEITRSENKFTLDGVNFELLSETDDSISTDKPIKFEADNQSDKMFEKIKTFIDDYNAIVDNVNKKVYEHKAKDGIYLPLTDIQRKEMSETEIKNWEAKAKKGLFQNDMTLDILHTDMHHAMTDNLKDSQDALFQIGIATKPYDYSYSGKLEIDEEKLKKALNDDPDKVAALFTGEDGIATRIQKVIDKNIKTTGADKGRLIVKAGSENSIGVDHSTLTSNIKDYTDKIKELKRKMETQQEFYYAKFTRLEKYLSLMNSQAGLFLQNTQE